MANWLERLYRAWQRRVYFFGIGFELRFSHSPAVLERGRQMGGLSTLAGLPPTVRRAKAFLGGPPSKLKGAGRT